MHPMEPVKLVGYLIAIEPLCIEHASGLLAAADADEVFDWLPYSRPTGLDQARTWIEQALEDRDAHRRFPFAVLNVDGGSVIWLDFPLGLRCAQRPCRDRLDLAQPFLVADGAQCRGKVAVDDPRF